MKGCRPLSDEEVKLISQSFSGTFGKRNKVLFVVGYRTGFRISELLSLTVGDVQQHGKIVDHVTVARRHMKKKTEGRTVPLHPEARAALSVWLEGLSKMLKGALDPQTPVFCSRVRDTATGLRRAISREQAWRILKEAFASNELTGKLGTHAMRKTFANRMYDKLNRDLMKVQRAMGHRNINSTVAYLSFREEDIDDAILAA
jgi:site-specific recombinase XerD